MARVVGLALRRVVATKNDDDDVFSIEDDDVVRGIIIAHFWEKRRNDDFDATKTRAAARVPRSVRGLRNVRVLATPATRGKKRKNRAQNESVSRDGSVTRTLGRDRNDGGVSTGQSGRRFSRVEVDRDRTESENAVGNIEQREKSRTRGHNADEREKTTKEKQEEEVLVVAVSF